MKFVSWIILIVVCLAVALGLGAFKYREIQAGIEMGKAFPEPVEAIETFIARGSSWQPSTRVSAEVIAPQTANVSNELPGRITEVGFAPGAQVTKGQLLIALDTSEENARLLAAQADEEIARLGFDRASRLVERGAGSREDRDRARAQHEAAKANTQTLRAIIGKKRVVAPFDALTSLHTLERGQYLAANTTVASLVGTGGQAWIDFALPQQLANSVVGESVTVVQQDRLLGQARIIARDAAINPQSRNLRMRAVIDADLLPGTLLSVDVAVGAQENVVSVPATAIRRNALGSSVYVIASANDGATQTDTENDVLRAARRSVTVGRAVDFDATTQQQMVVITSGLNAGERIAANGAFKLRDGMKVNVISSGAAELGE